MLNRLITLAIVLAIVYLAATRGVPWLKEKFGSVSAGGQTSASSEALDCVDRASQANDTLTRTARRYAQPPVDLDAWTEAVWQIESQIQTAESECSCPSESCQKASQALGEMRTLLTNLDGMLRGDSAAFVNPARQQERIFRYLNDARSAGGS